MAKNNSNGIAQGIMVIIFILIYPFVWLYDKLGAGMFWALITILFGGGLAWWGLNTKKKKEQRKKTEKNPSKSVSLQSILQSIHKHLSHADTTCFN